MSPSSSPESPGPKLRRDVLGTGSIVFLVVAVGLVLVGHDVEEALHTASKALAYAFDLPQATAILLNAEQTECTIVSEYPFIARLLDGEAELLEVAGGAVALLPPQGPDGGAGSLEGYLGSPALTARYGSVDAALRDTVRRLEETGSPVITDGEQTKPSFATYAIHGTPRKVNHRPVRPIRACSGSAGGCHLALRAARPEPLDRRVEGRGEVTLMALVRQSLRMRPDRVVVGEVRGAEVRELLLRWSPKASRPGPCAPVSRACRCSTTAVSSPAAARSPASRLAPASTTRDVSTTR